VKHAFFFALFWTNIYLCKTKNKSYINLPLGAKVLYMSITSFRINTVIVFVVLISISVALFVLSDSNINVAFVPVIVLITILPLVVFYEKYRKTKLLIDDFRREHSDVLEKLSGMVASRPEKGGLMAYVNQLKLENIKREEELKEQTERESVINWINSNLSNVAEVLRSNNHSLNDLSREVLKALIDILKLNQGGLFVKEEVEERHVLRLECAIAWERERFAQKECEVGYGLIGRAAFERKTIFLTDLPENYIEITSGLGKALPRCVVIVPLIYNDEVVGVIELASFEELTPVKVEFLEKSAYAIAASIASMKISEHTNNLLLESQKNTEMLRAQEEEMRQNLEEMQATQEEMMRKEALLKKLGYEMQQQENKLIEKIAEIKKTRRTQISNHETAYYN